MTEQKNKICKWYYCCPIRRYSEEGKLDISWVNNYCLQSNPACIRYKMEESGQYHPDNMLPDGSIDPSV